MKTKVIFRVFNKGKDVIALFPNIITDNDYNVMSYQQVGQHGAANYNHVLKISKRAYHKDYKSLLNELINIGYDLEIRRRR